MKRVIFLAIFMTIVSGCSDPGKASESNFADAIQVYIEAKYPKCIFKINFPAESIAVDISGTNKKLNAMSQAGLLTEKKMHSQEHKSQTGFIYHLTDKGIGAYNLQVSKSSDGKALGGFCFGVAEVDDIKKYSKPSDKKGALMSQVIYTYKVSNIPDWAFEPAVMEAFPEIRAMVKTEERPAKGVATLVLSDQGWIHKNLLKE